MPFILSRTINIFLAQLNAHFYLLVGVSLLGLILLPWLSKEFNRIVPLIIYSSFNSVLAIFCAIIFKNNSAVFHAFSLIGTALILYYYYPQLKNMPHMRSLFWYGFGGYFIIWLINIIYFQPHLIFPSNSIMFSSVLILFFVLTSFKHMLDNPTNKPLFVQPRFWVNTGTLIFYTSGFFYFFIHTYLQKTGQYPVFLKFILYYPNLIWIGCLAIGLFSDIGVFSFKKHMQDGNKL